MSDLFDILINVFTVTTFFAYCSGVHELRYSRVKSIVMFALWAVMLAGISHFFRYVPPLRFTAVILAMQLSLRFLFKGKLSAQIRTNVECTVMSLVCELTATVIHLCVASSGFDITSYDTPGRAVMSLVSTALSAGIIPIAILIRKRSFLHELWRVVLCQTAICVTQISMMMIAFISASSKTEELVMLIAVVQIPGILLSLFCTRVILYISKLEIGKTCREFEDIKAEMEYDFYKLAIESNAQISVLRHDMNNTLQTALALIRNGESAKGSELLYALEEASRAVSPVVHCDNEIVNVILGIKNEEMKKQGISLKVVVTSELVSLPPTDMELTSVLTNLLDNAAEACISSENERNITVGLGHIQGYYIIKVTNSCSPEKVYIPDNLTKAETTKTDKEFHGFGLRSVYEISKRYNGDFSMYADGANVVSVVPLRRIAAVIGREGRFLPSLYGY